MRIDTRFGLNDEVWYMSHNKAEKGTVTAINTLSSINKGVCRTEVQYHISCTGVGGGYIYDECFATKDDLLKSL